MSQLRLSRHAHSRIHGRLKDIITLREVAEGVTGCRFNTGETWVKVKSLPGDIKLDGSVIGDTVYIIVHRNGERDNGTVVTVELRQRHQKIKGDYYIDRT